MNVRLILIALFLTLALPAQAQERTYNSVEEIIRETRFRIVDLETYKREIKAGKVVGLYFHNDFPKGASGFLAKLFMETMGPFTGLRFIALPDDPNVRDQTYVDMGFKIAPTTAFYVNGKRVFINNGGPRNKQEYDETIPLMRSNLEYLGTLN